MWNDGIRRRGRGQTAPACRFFAAWGAGSLYSPGTPVLHWYHHKPSCNRTVKGEFFVLDQRQKLFTIGQFAAIHGVTKKTLMWYDEIGLVTPAVIGENGYRYYTYQQSSTLETVLMLRELNVSIPEIKGFMEHRSASGMEQLLSAQIRELEERIAHLRTMKKTLVSRHQDMMALLHLDLSEISVVQRKKSCLAVVPVEQELPAAADVERVIGAVKRHKLQRLHDAVYGSMIAVEHLYQGHFDRYGALYVELPRLSTQKGLHIRPAGRYLRAFCKGPWDNLPGRYEEILAYAGAHGLKLYGWSYETGLNESVIDSFDEYITQIEIPIRE